MNDFRYAMNDFRYAMNANSTDPERIYRGSLLNLREAGYDTTDEWTSYWDGDQMIAFVDYFTDGMRSVTDNDVNNLTSRVMDGYKRSGDKDRYLALAAKALGGSDFLTVYLDRGSELHALWMGEDDTVAKKAWRDEIEHVYNGEVYRIEVESRLPGDDEWVHEDDVCEQFYGETQAEAGLLAEFPLDELPIHALVSSDG